VRALRSPLPGEESGRQVLAFGVLATLAIATIDLTLSGRLTMFFDLAFITLCLGLGQLPRRDALFFVAFLPPLVLVLSFGVLGIVHPDGISQVEEGVLQSMIRGLTDHAAALAIGYGLCLATLGLRQRSLVGATRTG
jgi:hypothetical protein